MGVGDSQTWASDLSRLLGPHYEVQNYGVLAYTSLEAMIQSLFVFRDIKPVCAVYYEGWNDLINAHIDNLQNDYAPFQAMRVLQTLAADYRPGIIADNWLFLQLIDRMLQQGSGYPPSTSTMSDQPDPRLAQIYAENIKLIADIDRHFGVTPIFVPQILNYDYIEAHYGGWWPTISGPAVRPRMRDLNSVMGMAAKEAGAVLLNTPLDVPWQSTDFVDDGHFSAAGAAKFAQALAPVIAANCK